MAVLAILSGCRAANAKDTAPPIDSPTVKTGPGSACTSSNLASASCK
jgi:hypothetical protein